MMNRKRVFWATTALFTGLMAAGAASAQSTGSMTVEETAVDEVVVTGARGPRNVDGAIVAQEVGKSRSTVTQEYLARQQPGQNTLQSLNLQPGVNFNNNDAYGNSGGDLTIRGFDAQRISTNLDGIQLNDTGNYQIYPTQQIDPELLERVSVNQGTTDVDSPTAAGTGGTVNFVTRRPSREFGAIIQPSVGTDAYMRFFGLVDTGEVGPWGTSAWLSYSANKYEQFDRNGVINPGDLERWAVNGRVYQPIRGNGDFLSVAFRYQEDRNNTYGRKNVRDFNNGLPIAGGNTASCQLLAPGAGAQNHSTTALNPGCSNFYGTFFNPTDSFNVRGQSRFTLTDKLTLTVDPQFSYTLANGGGVQNIAETDQRLQGSIYNPATAATRIANGVDLNGDGDILDTIRLYSPSNTRTNRVSVNTSLIYDLDDNNRFRLSYTHDFGVHRQTGEYSRVNLNGLPNDWFGGVMNNGEQILTLDGTVFQKRNRRSTAELNQVSLQYVGDFFDNAVTLDLGVRVPFFTRQLQNFCYQLDTFDATCSAQAPRVATGAQAGNLVTPTPGAPTAFSRKYDDILPNVNVTWRFAPNQQIFASYSKNLSAPRTDDLYDRIAPNPEPETTQNYDLGYRYQSGRLIASVSTYYSAFENYIVRAFEEVVDENGVVQDTIAYTTNAGDVDRWGVDGQLGYFFNDNFSVYATASYLGSEIKSNIPSPTIPVPPALPVPYATEGNELFEVPEWQYGLRAQYEVGPLTLGIQGKYVGERWTTLVCQSKTAPFATGCPSSGAGAGKDFTPAYTLVDLDVRYALDNISEGTYLQINAQNIFDELYLADIATATAPSGSGQTANLGAPRSVVATLRIAF